jgi:hypothetical protein
MITSCIERHIDPVALAENERVERLEQGTLREYVKNFRLAPNSLGGAL